MVWNDSIWSVVRRLCLGAMVYFIWQERIAMKFRNEKRTCDCLIGMIEEPIRMILMSLVVKKSHTIKELENIWEIKFQKKLSEYYVMRVKRKYQPIGYLADPRQQPPFSCLQLGDEGTTSEGAKMNQTIMNIEVYTPTPIGPCDTMVDSQPEWEGVQGVEEEGTRIGSREGPSAQTLLAQTTPFLAFIKENIDMLMTIIKEHDQQTKTKETPKKLTYYDSKEEGSKSSKTKGLTKQSSNGSSRMARTRNKACFPGKSLRSLSHSKTSSHLRRSDRLGSRGRSKAKAKEGRTKSRTRRFRHKETSLDSDYEEGSEDTYKDLSTP
nr:reverse transcriptase zinc-binding domain-containing protein [Tanacetum cinerariifolium]